jgi:hypothetical protein
MALDNALLSLVRVEGEERCPKVKEGTLSGFQEQLLEYDKCYKGQLFDDPNRCYEWGRRYDPFTRSPIARELWKPNYMPQTGRELVDTQTANLVGKDKFPAIRVTSAKPLFAHLPTPEPEDGDESTPEQRQARAQAKALQAFADKVLSLAELPKQAVEAVRMGLVRGEEPLLLRVHGKKPRLTVRNRTWCHWGYLKDDPDTLAWYREAFFFKRKVPDDKGVIQDKWFLFLRQINQQLWLEQEYPIETDPATGQETFGPAVEIRRDQHALGYVPVSIYATPDRQSMYANGVLENVKHHIEGYNDVRAGTLKNAQPQWVALKDGGTNGSNLALGTPGQKKEPLRPGELWELEAKSIASFSNQVEGYTTAGQLLEQERQAMRASSGILDIPPDNEQSGRALILRLAPQFSSTDNLRTSFGPAIVDTVRKTLLAALKHQAAIDFGPDLALPSTLEGIEISVDWGQLLPITPEVVAEEIANVKEMRAERLMSKQSAMEYLLPLFGIDDIASEQARLAAEAAEELEQQLALAEAAFERENQEQEDTPNGQSDFT